VNVWLDFDYFTTLLHYYNNLNQGGQKALTDAVLPKGHGKLCLNGGGWPPASVNQIKKQKNENS
jgi:hypothetical protein